MKITLSPTRSDARLVVAKRGDVLTINGEAFDLSVIPEGATLPASAVATPWLVGPIHRQGGELELTLILPHGPKPTQAQAFPEPLLDPPDGLLDLPRDPPLPEPAHDEH